MVLSSTVGPKASQLDQGSAAFALAAERIARAVAFVVARRDAVTIEQAPGEAGNLPKT